MVNPRDIAGDRQKKKKKKKKKPRPAAVMADALTLNFLLKNIKLPTPVLLWR